MTTAELLKILQNIFFSVPFKRKIDFRGGGGIIALHKF